MNNRLTIPETFRQTTIDSQTVTDFLTGLPNYYEAGCAMNAGPLARRLLYRTDGFEFELRLHLAGETRTKYHLNRSIRSFLSLDDYAARHVIRFSLDAVQATILENEWYEVMPSYRRIRQHIKETFGI